VSRRIDDPDGLRELLATTRRVAVVGLSADESRPSHGVARNLQAAGYEIVPVNPKWLGREILGVPVVARLTDISGEIDVVDAFRRAIDMPRVVDDAIAAGAKALWMQLGIINEAEAQRALDAGLDVVMDRCMMAEHRRLVGS
jgi:predicted CoA-binding protein